MPGFFPPEFQSARFAIGDVFADLENGRYGIMRILTIDRVELASGDPITIAGQTFVTTTDDFLLVVGCALGEPEFASIDEVRHAVQSGHWRPQIEHAPMRATCVTPAQVWLCNTPVHEGELAGYRHWQREFAEGTAGIF